MIHVALVVGHSTSSRGARNKNGETEFSYNQKLVSLIKCNSNVKLTIFYRNRYKDLPFEINKMRPDYIISFHCNAYNTEASGSEVLFYYKSDPGAQLAAGLLTVIHTTLSLKNRGIKPRSSEDRGGYLLRYTNAPCVILEPFFIDNDVDLQVGLGNRERLATNLSNYFNNLGEP